MSELNSGLGFHIKDGLHIRRKLDGSVQLLKATPDEAQSPHVIAEIASDIWASCVASVSAYGETGLTWSIAKALHG